MDKKERVHLIKTKVDKRPPGTVPVGITWVDGRVLYQDGKVHSMIWYGICNHAKAIWAIAPLDYERITMLTTIRIHSQELYCEKAYMCLNFECYLNQFSKHVFEAEFGDCGLQSLGVPMDIGKKPLWFNTQEYRNMWSKLFVPLTGGILRFDEEKAKKVLGKGS